MLKNKIIVRKIRNIAILLMVLLIMYGAYRNIDRSRAEDVVQIAATALDSYGYLSEEQFSLDARQIEDNLYEIELPESVNSKKINNIFAITLIDKEPVNENSSTTPENTAQEAGTVVEDESEATEEKNKPEIVENKIYLTKEQMDSKIINFEVRYDVMILKTAEDGTSTKKILSTLAEDEIEQEYLTEETQKLYNKILKYENEETGKTVEVEGFLPIDAQLDITEVTQEKIATIFQGVNIAAAYDIKIVQQVKNEIPQDEVNTGEAATDVIEYIPINPNDFGEICEVTIKGENIKNGAQVYHVKGDNTYEQVNLKESIDQSISFEASTFSIYAVSAVEETSTETEDDSTEGDITQPDGTEDDNSTDSGETDSTEGEITDGTESEETPTEGEIPDIDLEVGTTASDGSNSSYFGWSGTTPSSSTWRKSKATVTVNVTSGGYITAYDWKNTTSPSGVTSLGTTASNVQTLTSEKTSTGSSWYFFIKFYNTSSKTSTIYYRGPFKVDASAPTQPDTSGGSSSWTDSDVSVAANSTDSGSGISYWQYKTSSGGTWTDLTGTTSTSKTFTSTCNYSVYFRAIDAVGNVGTATPSGVPVKIDKTRPTLSASTTSCSWRGSALSVTLTAYDAHSGMKSGNSYQYYLSTSDTALSGGSWKTYTSGTAFSLNPSTSGTYYLFVKRILDAVGWYSNYDSAGTDRRVTVDGTTYLRFGAYQFDKTAPSITFSKNGDAATAGGEPNIVTSGLIRHYRASKNLGSSGHSLTTTTWTDLTGTQNATLVNGPTWSDEYLNLDGSNDWVNLGIANASKMTLEIKMSINALQTDSVNLLGATNSGGMALCMRNGVPRIILWISRRGWLVYM